MTEEQIFQRENQHVAASDILEALAQGLEIKLFQCTVSGDMDLNRLTTFDEKFDTSKIGLEKSEQVNSITLPEQISFNSCIFEGNVYFAPPWETPESLDVAFEKNVMFNSSTFKNQARFSKSSFRSRASFDGCSFERVAVFQNTVFHGETKFRTVYFAGYGLFSGATFKQQTSFTNTCFSKGGNFTNVRFEGETDFSGVYSMSKSVPVYESVWFARRSYGDDETFWRFIKQASQEAGYYQLAGESFYHERCAHLWKKFRGPQYDQLTLPKKIARLFSGMRLLPEVIFGKYLFGYGERPIRVLFASALIILVCACFYASSPDQLTHRTDIAYSAVSARFMDGLYFSITTFTTLGFGDIYPNSEYLLTRIVAMTEALCGACLTALFVVSLAKRFSRG